MRALSEILADVANELQGELPGDRSDLTETVRVWGHEVAALEAERDRLRAVVNEVREWAKFGAEDPDTGWNAGHHEDYLDILARHGYGDER